MPRPRRAPRRRDRAQIRRQRHGAAHRLWMRLGTRGGKEDFPVDNYEIAVDKLRICSRPVDATSVLAQSMHRQGRIRRSRRRTLNRKEQGKAGTGTLGGAARKRRPTEVPLRGEGRPQGRLEPRGTDRSSCRPQGGWLCRDGCLRGRCPQGGLTEGTGLARRSPARGVGGASRGRPPRNDGMGDQAGEPVSGPEQRTGRLGSRRAPTTLLGTIAISRRPREAWRRKPTSYPGLFRIPPGAPRASSYVSTVPGGL